MPDGQSLRGAEGGATGDLVLWPSQPAGRGHQPIEPGKLWESEFGPWGGDELNIPQAGRNYGWPVVSWGKHYDGTRIPAPPTHPEFADAIAHWTPVISPSGIAFYTGDAIPAWKGNLLIGGLSSEALVRLTLDGEDGEGRGAHPHGHPHPRRGARPPTVRSTC